MNNIGNIKHVFPGSNTPQGFFSFFSYIIPEKPANRLYVIKGGPGTGKSSFMKKIGTFATERGLDVEFFHCSSDPGSLDAVFIPSLNIALLDGTAPHVVDPITPGAVDKILNFGDFWDENKLRNARTQITDYTNNISNHFKKAYCYLAAGKNIYDGYQLVESPIIDQSVLLNLENTILNTVFMNVKPTGSYGRDRHLFSTAITGEGFLDYLNTLIGNTQNIFFIKETIGCHSKNLMNRIKENALLLGLNLECYHSAIDPSKIEDIYIPSLNTFITVSNPFHKPKIFPTHIYDFTAALNYTQSNDIRLELEKDYKLMSELFNKGIQCIASAKKLHDGLEEFYVGAVDFEKIDNLLTKLITEIFDAPTKD
ncbi:MAG: hypothetical protein AB9856_18765 [Cellulosilyticaceae bacterium]